jgi:trans-aconitate methyltransferase
MGTSVEFIRSLSFGSVADEYERYRLSYPEELVDTIEQFAQRPLRSALEVGAGTGKATRLFASRGFEVTALEPDSAMATVLRSTTRGLSVDPVVTTFEEFESDRRFDLVYAAAAWHWTDPASRWVHATELLVPGGVLALFGRSTEPSAPELCAAIEEIEARVLSDEDDSAVIHPWSVEDLASTAGLVDSTQQDMDCVLDITAVDFIGRLATVSAYLMLSPQDRDDALRQILAVLPHRFEIDATVQLSLARRA